jgi:adenine-specific DNA-methyltransferase
MNTMERNAAAASMGGMLEVVEKARHEVSKGLDQDTRERLGQFLTPARVAQFMASLFEPTETRRVSLLDPGAGVGSLTAAFLDRWISGALGNVTVDVVAYELYDSLTPYLRNVLEGYHAAKTGLHFAIKNEDFVEAAVNEIEFNGRRDFTHAILNPPYKKIASDSSHRLLLRQVGIETVNAYTAFLALVIELMAPGGQVVAIIPRSFCNGPYYRPFRELLLRRCAIEHIHLFESRTSAFRDDAVLQENIIVKLVRGGKQGAIRVSTSRDAALNDLALHTYTFADIVDPSDGERFIHVPTTPAQTSSQGVPLAAITLAELGMEVSTGPVVDFRMKEHLRDSPGRGTVPLVYAHHFVGGKFTWPQAHKKKPNAIAVHRDAVKWLLPQGTYTLVKRFSSKEERRRVVAYVLRAEDITGSQVGIENHLNVFHRRRQGLEEDMAHGLAAYLNSSAIDDYFRRFSGHTQVNATDLRQLKYPTEAELVRLGRWIRKQCGVSQQQIDAYLVKNDKR